MIQFLTSHFPFLRKCRRKRLHKNFVYNSICHTQNKGVRVLNTIDHTTSIEKIRKARKRKGETKPYCIYRISEEDVNILLAMKKYKGLNNKYSKRLTLLEF